MRRRSPRLKKKAPAHAHGADSNHSVRSLHTPARDSSRGLRPCSCRPGARKPAVYGLSRLRNRGPGGKSTAGDRPARRCSPRPAARGRSRRRPSPVGSLSWSDGAAGAGSTANWSTGTGRRQPGGPLDERREDTGRRMRASARETVSWISWAACRHRRERDRGRHIRLESASSGASRSGLIQIVAMPIGCPATVTGTTQRFVIRVGCAVGVPARRSAVQTQTREIGPGLVVASKSTPFVPGRVRSVDVVQAGDHRSGRDISGDLARHRTSARARGHDADHHQSRHDRDDQSRQGRPARVTRHASCTAVGIRAAPRPSESRGGSRTRPARGSPARRGSTPRPGQPTGRGLTVSAAAITYASNPGRFASSARITACAPSRVSM